MKKIYSIVLMAMMLLIGTTAWATTYQIGGTDPGDGHYYANLKSFKAAMPSLNLSSSDEIVLGAHQSLASNGVYNFGGAKIKNAEFRFNIAAASTFTLQNAVIEGTSNIFYGNKSNGTGTVTLNLENVKISTTGNQVFELRTFGYNVNFDEDCAVSSKSYTFYIRPAVAMNVTNDADMDWSIALYDANANDQTFTNKAGHFTYIQSNAKAFTGNVTISGSNTGDGAATIKQTADLRYPEAASLTLNNITVVDGTIRNAVAGVNITVTGGTFLKAPKAGSTGTISGECKFPAGPAIGNFTIAAGYRGVADGHIYAESATPDPVIMLTHNGTTQTFAYLEDAFAAAQDGDEISLLDDIDQLSTVWLGTQALNGTPRSLTLDLAGHAITSDPRIAINFIISHGSLLVKNSVPDQGGIYNMYSGSRSEVFRLHGSYFKNCDPRINTPFTHLTIEEGVNIYAQETEGSGVCIYEIRNNTGEPAVRDYINYLTSIYMGSNGVANGVRVDMKGNVFADKYGVKINGNVVYPWNPSSGESGAMREVDQTAFPDYQGPVAKSDSAYSPYIYIYPTARLVSSADQNYATAIYASGYGRWLIKGTCTGATGVYAKSGDIDLNDAVIESTWTSAEATTTGGSSGIQSGGNAVVIESNSHYSGEQKVTVNGDTKISTEANGGAAIIDVVDQVDHESLVEVIAINGGSFTGGENGYAIVISEQSATSTETEISVSGVTLVGETQVGTETGTAAVNAIIDPTEVHTTEIENADGSKTVIISAGSEPDAATEWTDVADMEEGSDAKWTGFTAGVIANGDTVKLGELQIISADGTTGKETQQLTIENNAILEVERLIMNDYARIIVEAGGKLIVTGTQGINAPVAENILLKTSQDAQAIFLFHPNVASNRHPNATIEFISKGHKFADNSLAWQRFGIPSYGALTEVTATNPTVVAAFNFENNTWENIGLVGSTLDYDKMGNAFDYYQMTSNVLEMGTVVTMKGQLYGNESPVLNVRGNAWNGFANSYMAPINGKKLLSMIPNTVQKAFYLNKIQDNQASWASVTELNVMMGIMEDIKPMQPFLIKNSLAAADATIDYATAVYNPATGAAAAPARRAMTDLTASQLIVKGENGIDELIVAESEEFSAEFDNGFDAVKYMNDGINLFVSADEKMSNFATDDLNNTYVGFQTVNGGTYTIEFANVYGAELTLVDHETGARVAMVEGNAYEFTAAANSVNDYRFEIVESAKLPTAIDNTEAVKSAKGIYTITGQYVGEMNVWNTLPAGVYVINGEKCVK